MNLFQHRDRYDWREPGGLLRRAVVNEALRLLRQPKMSIVADDHPARGGGDEPSGEMDQRGPLSKHGPRYLRWGLMEAAIHAAAHPLYRERYQRTKRRLGRQRGAKVAQIDLARKLTEAIWYMLTRNQPFAPAGATVCLAA